MRLAVGVRLLWCVASCTRSVYSSELDEGEGDEEDDDDDDDNGCDGVLSAG